MTLKVPFRRLASEFGGSKTEGDFWRRVGGLLDRNFAEIERARYSLGYVDEKVASGASDALNDTVTPRTLPGTSVTISNTTGVTRRYKITAAVRFNMVSGANGLYRPLVTDGGTTSLGGGTEQVNIQVTGGSGQSGANTWHITTVASGATLTVAAGGLRVAGGGTTDTAVSGRCLVEDLGPV